MQQKLTWLKVSLFTKMWNWHYLLREIELFISKNRHYVVDYLFEFNSLCGENIRLAILVSDDSVTEFVPLIDDYFKSFFSTGNLRTEPALLPVTGIFKPFEQNTVQYGLFDISYKIDSSEAKLGVNLSRVILTALKDDEIDDETIITFAFYLHSAILKASKDGSGLSYEVGDYYANSVSLTGSDISIEFLADKFKSNKQDLADIYEDIMVENKLNLPGWLADWIAYIKDEMEINNADLTDVLKIEKHYKITSIVNQQLGLSRDSWLITRYFFQYLFHYARL